MGATKVGELFVELVVDAASGNLSVRQMVGALGDLDVASLGTVGVFTKVSERLWEMAKAATETAVQLTELHDITGADPALVQKWQLAAERLHVSGQSIVNSIMAVNSIQKQMENGGGQPRFMGQYGIDATKIQDGKRAYKDLFDYIKEFSAPGSRYQQLGPKLQQSLLDSMFGGSANDMFRLIKDVGAGKVDLNKVYGLSDKQIGSLDKVSADWIAVKQDVTGLFDKLLTGGEMVDKILVGAQALLEAVNKLLDSPSVRKMMGEVGTAVGDTLAGKRTFQTIGNIIGAGIPLGDMIGKDFDNRLALARAGAAPRGAGADGKLTVNIKHRDRPVATKTFSQKELINADMDALTQQFGLTP